MTVDHPQFRTSCAICSYALTYGTCAVDEYGVRWGVCTGWCARKAGIRERGALVMIPEPSEHRACRLRTRVEDAAVRRAYGRLRMDA